MTNPKNDFVKEWLRGRYQEFPFMSLKPGIGASAMRVICDSLCSEFGPELLREGDVPLSLRHGKKDLPLGRYLRSKLREAYGFEEIGTPKEALLQLSQKMCEMFESELDLAGGSYGEMFRRRREKKTQKIRNLEGRHKLFSQRRYL